MGSCCGGGGGGGGSNDILTILFPAFIFDTTIVRSDCIQRGAHHLRFRLRFDLDPAFKRSVSLLEIPERASERVARLLQAIASSTATDTPEATRRALLWLTMSERKRYIMAFIRDTQL